MLFSPPQPKRALQLTHMVDWAFVHGPASQPETALPAAPNPPALLALETVSVHFFIGSARNLAYLAGSSRRVEGKHLIRAQSSRRRLKHPTTEPRSPPRPHWPSCIPWATSSARQETFSKHMRMPSSTRLVQVVLLGLVRGVEAALFDRGTHRIILDLHCLEEIVLQLEPLIETMPRSPFCRRACVGQFLPPGARGTSLTCCTMGEGCVRSHTKKT